MKNLSLLVKKVEKAIGTIVKRGKSFIVASSGALTFMILNTSSAYASSAEVTAPLVNLKVLMIAIVAAVGAIYLVKNIMEFATAYQAQDSSSMHSATKGIVSGVLMVLCSTVLAILGV